jgi:hypothetical protein
MNERLNELFKTMQENPGLEILFFVDNNEICDPAEYDYTTQSIKKIEVDYCYSGNDEYDTVVGVHDVIKMLVEIEGFARETAETEFKKLLESGIIVKKIVVYLGA